MTLVILFLVGNNNNNNNNSGINSNITFNNRVFIASKPLGALVKDATMEINGSYTHVSSFTCTLLANSKTQQ